MNIFYSALLDFLSFSQISLPFFSTKLISRRKKFVLVENSKNKKREEPLTYFSLSIIFFFDMVLTHCVCFFQEQPVTLKLLLIGNYKHFS